MSWLYVAITVLLTVYGQIIVKWQVERAGALPIAWSDRIEFLTRLVLNPWVLSALLAAFVAAMSWMLAMTKLELSRAYPFMGLSFVFVLVLSGVFFNEALSTPKVVGVGLIVAGLVVGSRV